MKKLFLLTSLFFVQNIKANDFVCSLVGSCQFVKDFTKKEKTFLFAEVTYKNGHEIRIPGETNRKNFSYPKSKNGGDSQAANVEACFKTALEFAESLKDLRASDLGGNSDETICRSFVRWSYVDTTTQKFKDGKVSMETRRTLLDAYKANSKSLSLKIEGDNRFYSTNSENGETLTLPFEGKAFSPQILE